MTYSENDRDLFQANLNSLLFGKFRGGLGVGWVGVGWVGGWGYELRSNFMTSTKPVFA